MNRKRSNAGEIGMEKKVLRSNSGGDKRVTRSSAKSGGKKTPPVSRKPMTKKLKPAAKKKILNSPKKQTKGTTNCVQTPTSAAKSKDETPDRCLDLSVLKRAANTEQLSVSDLEDYETQAPPKEKRIKSVGSPSRSESNDSDDDLDMIEGETKSPRKLLNPDKETEYADDECSSFGEQNEMESNNPGPSEAMKENKNKTPLILLDSDSNGSEAEMVESTAKLRSYLIEPEEPQEDSDSEFQPFHPRSSSEEPVSVDTIWRPPSAPRGFLSTSEVRITIAECRGPAMKPIQEEVIEIPSSEDESDSERPPVPVPNRPAALIVRKLPTVQVPDAQIQVQVDENLEEYHKLQNSWPECDNVTLNISDYASSVYCVDYHHGSYKSEKFPGVTTTSIANFRNTSIGFLKIEPRTIKPVERLERISSVYTLMKGVLVVKSIQYKYVETTKVLEKIFLTKGSALTIPPNHPFIFENRTDDEAILHYVVTQH